MIQNKQQSCSLSPCKKIQHGMPGWLSGWASAFGSGWDPRVLESSPASGSPQGACFSLCLCLCSLCVSHEWIKKKKKKKSFFFLRLFIYLFMRDTHTERQRHRQREKQAPWREPDVGLDPGTPGSCPGPKAGTNLLSHPGIPIHLNLIWFVSIAGHRF